MTPERGTRLGPYQIESPIGAGGMGEVYKATDTPGSEAAFRARSQDHLQPAGAKLLDFRLAKPVERLTESPNLQQIVVVHNWFSELERLVP